MGDSVFVVSYATGEYSDRYDWAECWYPTREEAEAHAAAFNAVLAPAQAAMQGAPRQPRLNDNAAWDRFVGDLRAFVVSHPAVIALQAWWPEHVLETEYQVRDINPATVSEVPRGTLPLHGLEAAR